MLKWEPGRVEGWEDCDSWYTRLLKSSGFEKQDPERLRIKEDIKTYPKEVQLSIEESLPYYNLLRSHKLNPAVQIIQ